MIQAIIFKNSQFNLKKSKEWLKKHNYNYKSYRTTKNFFRFRLIEPSKKYYYRIKKISDNIFFVLMFLKK